MENTPFVQFCGGYRCMYCGAHPYPRFLTGNIAQMWCCGKDCKEYNKVYEVALPFIKGELTSLEPRDL